MLLFFLTFFRFHLFHRFYFHLGGRHIECGVYTIQTAFIVILSLACPVECVPSHRTNPGTTCSVIRTRCEGERGACMTDPQMKHPSLLSLTHSTVLWLGNDPQEWRYSHILIIHLSFILSGGNATRLGPFDGNATMKRCRLSRDCPNAIAGHRPPNSPVDSPSKVTSSQYGRRLEQKYE